MVVKKNEKTKKYEVYFWYKSIDGVNKKKLKRGFKTAKDAKDWAKDFLERTSDNLDMIFESFVKIYLEDIRLRVRLNTFRTKEYIINLKIIPYFKSSKLNEIKASDIRKWQNQLISQGYKDTYLKSIHNQLSAIFNFACSYYDLRENPCKKTGSMGKSNAGEMSFYTLEEFNFFLDSISDKRMSYIGFSILFWCGCRIGELLALTVGDFDEIGKVLIINKSYQRIECSDIITPPKTPAGNRLISLPDFLVEQIKDYISSLYKPDKLSRLFPVTKYYFEHEMTRGSKRSGMKKIRLHSLRHSHTAHCIELGMDVLIISKRLGHESTTTTLEIYGHLYPNKQRELAMALNEDYKKGVLQ